MKAFIKLHVNNFVESDDLAVTEVFAVKEFETATSLRELVQSVLEEFHLQQMTVQSLKFLDSVSKQLVDVGAAEQVRDMGEYEVSLVGGVNAAIGSGPSATGSQLSANRGQDCPSGSLRIMSLTGRTTRINVISRNGPYEVAGCRLTDTVGRLKEVVSYLDGISPCEQRLVFAGNHLEDDKTLADYNIQNNSTIRLILKLKGC